KKRGPSRASRAVFFGQRRGPKRSVDNSSQCLTRDSKLCRSRTATGPSSSFIWSKSRCKITACVLSIGCGKGDAEKEKENPKSFSGSRLKKVDPIANGWTVAQTS